MEIKRTMRYRHTLSEGPKSRMLTSNAGQDMEQQELSFTDGKAKLHSYFARQFGGSFLQN